MSGVCNYHTGSLGDDVQLVRIVETGSGPGGLIYACADCRAVHRLVALVDRLDKVESWERPRP